MQHQPCHGAMRKLHPFRLPVELPLPEQKLSPCSIQRSLQEVTSQDESFMPDTSGKGLIYGMALVYVRTI